MDLNTKLQWNERTLQQLLAYEALFKLLGDIQPLEDIDGISRQVAKQWKYFANVTSWRLVIPKDEDFQVIDGYRGEAHVMETKILSSWDEHYLTLQLPRLIRSDDPLDGPPPPEHLSGKAITEVEVLPFLRMGTCVGLLSVAARHKPFSELDNKFIRIFGSHFTDRISDILFRRRAMAALIKKASYDMLTGLLNRGSIIERLEDLLVISQGSEMPLGVILADIDHFKAINDSHGHLFGDRVLKEISQRLQTQILSGDNLGRYGGEEFLFVLYPCSSEEVIKAAERFRRAIAEHPLDTADSSMPKIKVTISLGTSSTSGAGIVKPETLLKRADEALYISKGSGRNRVTAG